MYERDNEEIGGGIIGHFYSYHVGRLYVVPFICEIAATGSLLWGFYHSYHWKLVLNNNIV